MIFRNTEAFYSILVSGFLIWHSLFSISLKRLSIVFRLCCPLTLTVD
jgi:hypothetical protein